MTAPDRAGQRWHQLESLWEAALELPRPERRNFLERSAPEDLRDELLSLIDSEDGAESFFTRFEPVVGAGAEMAVHRSILEAIGPGLADRYRLEHELGQGGTATVFLAHDLRRRRRVALKVLDRSFLAPAGVRRFREEIRIMADLDHPHILGFLESGEVIVAGDEITYPWYTMPWVSGDSLRRRLSQTGPLPADDAVLIAREIADALDYAHRRGLLHLDIKPENVLLQDTHALVSDFGIARALTPGAEASSEGTPPLAGTPRYMSPEQTAGELDLDGRSDLYALGCVLLEMLAGSGVPPHAGERAPGGVQELLPDTLDPDLATALASVIARACARATVDRYGSAGELAAALGHIQPRLPSHGAVRTHTGS